jgi:FKBP12-rapamycin complex-associated protein
MLGILDLSRKLPNNLPDLIQAYKEFKHESYESWSVLRFSEASQLKRDYQRQLHNASQSRQGRPSMSIRICIGALVLSRYSVTSLKHCSEMVLTEIQQPPVNDPLAIAFVARYYAKYCNLMRQFDSTFLKRLLETVRKSLASPRNKAYAFEQSLLANLSAYAIRALDQRTLEFYDFLHGCVFQHTALDVRLSGFVALTRYLSRTRQRHFPGQLAEAAHQVISQWEGSAMQRWHGALLILTCLVDWFYPSFVARNEVQFVNKRADCALSSGDKDVQAAGILLSLTLAHGDKGIHPRLEEMLRTPLGGDPRIVIFGMRKFPQAFASRLKQVMAVLSGLKERDLDDQAYEDRCELLLAMSAMQSISSDDIIKVSKVLQQAVYKPALVKTLATIIQDRPAFWKAVGLDLQALLQRLGKDSNRGAVIHLIVVIPQLKGASSRLWTETLEWLKGGEFPVRRLVPAAVLRVASWLDYETRAVEILFDQAKVDRSWEMRVAILNSFSAPYPPCLASPLMLEQFQVLLNATHPRVRRATLKLLCKLLPLNPGMITPILRRVLVDALFVVRRSKSLADQADAAKQVAIVFSAAKSLFAIYVPVFLPITINYLTKHMTTKELRSAERPHTRQASGQTLVSLESVRIDVLPGAVDDRVVMNRALSTPTIRSVAEPPVPTDPGLAQQPTFFEREFARQVVIALINGIGWICLLDFERIERHIPGIVSLLLKIISRAQNKRVLLATLSCFGTIIDNLGPARSSRIPMLNSTLLHLGSQVFSAKIHSILFRLLGKIGPVEPDSKEIDFESLVHKNEYVDLSIPLPDFLVQIVVNNLTIVLDDRSDMSLHPIAHQALAGALARSEPSNSLHASFRRYMGRLFGIFRVVSEDERPAYFNLLGTILECPAEWLQEFAEFFFELVSSLWETKSKATLVELIPKLANSLKEAFSPWLPRITSMLLDSLERTVNTDKDLAAKILVSLTELTKFAFNFVFIIIHTIVTIIGGKDTNPEAINASLDALRSLVQKYDCAVYSSLVFRSCLTVLDNPQYRDKAVGVLSALRQALDDRFGRYAEVLKQRNFQLSKLAEYRDRARPAKPSRPQTFLNVRALVAAIGDIQFNKTLTEFEWRQCMDTFVLAFIENSPLPAVQACVELARKPIPFSRKIFIAAFMSCWLEMEEQEASGIIGFISRGISDVQSSPISVIIPLLSLLEFADRARHPIPIPFCKQTRAALRAAKPTFALRCAEQDYSPDTDIDTVLESLTGSYQQLGMFVEAKLFTKAVPKHPNVLLPLMRLESQEAWNDIIEQYDKMTDSIKSARRGSGHQLKEQAILILSNALLHQSMWQEFEDSISGSDSVEAAILHATAQVRRGQSVKKWIDIGFHALAQEGGSIFSHGFHAIAPFLIDAQRLVELEEKSQEKMGYWTERLHTTTCNFRTIRPLLTTRLAVLDGKEAHQHRLHFLRLARKANEWDAFEHFLNNHFGNETGDLAVQYEKVILMWQKGNHQEAMAKVDELLQNNQNSQDTISRSRLLFTFANWTSRTVARHGDEVQTIEKMKVLCCEALHLRPDHDRSMNLLGWLNMRLFDLYVTNCEDVAVESITAFARCVELKSRYAFADLLQMTSLLFRSSSLPIFARVESVVRNIDRKMYLKILPQILIYQYTRNPQLRKFACDLIHSLLSDYPNTVIFPLFFIERFGILTPRLRDFLSEFENSHQVFYRNSKVIWESLQNACVTIANAVLEGFQTIYAKSMSNVTENLYETIENLLARSENVGCGYDQQFKDEFRIILRPLYSVLLRCLESRNRDEIDSKRDDIRRACEKIQVKVNGESELFLHSVAPGLQSIKSGIISVPNTSETEGPLITIKYFYDKVPIQPTKQRPRKLKIRATNGKNYKFLLKGHEDLRQDQRVLQFFDLINSIVSTSMPKIIVTGVTPLSPYAGMIRWIRKCDTMYQLIRQYRRLRGVQIDEEIKFMCQLTTDHVQANQCLFDCLRPIHRLEAIEAVYSNEAFRPNDLREIMWLKAPDAESWARHIVNFSKTAAVMSIVGYVIGLGDRHPANLMIHRFTGGLAHIDFGDCFEVTKERHTLAEPIPFRLTRMMVAAFGPAGVEGSFRVTCQQTVSTIRAHREAIMPVLEIFIREPVSTGGYFDRLGPENVVSGSVLINEVEPKEKSMITRMKRMIQKLDGMDFENDVPLAVEQQVEQLIQSATDKYNLAYLYHGWNPTW